MAFNFVFTFSYRCWLRFMETQNTLGWREPSKDLQCHHPAMNSDTFLSLDQLAQNTLNTSHNAASQQLLFNFPQGSFPIYVIGWFWFYMVYWLDHGRPVKMFHLPALLSASAGWGTTWQRAFFASMPCIAFALCPQHGFDLKPSSFSLSSHHASWKGFKHKLHVSLITARGHVLTFLPGTTTSCLTFPINSHLNSCNLSVCFNILWMFLLYVSSKSKTKWSVSFTWRQLKDKWEKIVHWLLCIVTKR